MSTSAKSPHAGATVRHRERLYVAWWGWPLPLIAAGIIAAELQIAFAGIPGWLPYAILLPIAVVLLLLAGRAVVQISGEREHAELRVTDATLPLRFAGQVDVIGKKDKRKALGPDLDPAAYVVHRGWVGPMVRVRLTDPDDPTPYWLFSTRHPDRVAGLLRD